MKISSKKWKNVWDEYNLWASSYSNYDSKTTHSNDPWHKKRAKIRELIDYHIIRPENARHTIHPDCPSCNHIYKWDYARFWKSIWTQLTKFMDGFGRVPWDLQRHTIEKFITEELDMLIEESPQSTENQLIYKINDELSGQGYQINKRGSCITVTSESGVFLKRFGSVKTAVNFLKNKVALEHPIFRSM